MAVESARAERLDGIQALRALAALSVVVHHAAYDAQGLAARVARDFTLDTWFPWMAGVDLFFVISGFIMVHASARLFAMPSGAATFLRHRLARIVPLYWLTTTVFLLVTVLSPGALNSPPPTFIQVAASYAFIPAMRPDGLVQPVFSLGWTLNYEMFFYVLFAAALAFPRRVAVALVSACLVGVVALGRAIVLPLPLGFWANPIVLEFVAGMGLALFYTRGFRLPPAVAAPLAGLGVLVLVAPWSLGPAVLRQGLAATLIVAGVALAPPGPRPMARWITALGDSSYSLYLTHPFVVRALAVAFGLMGWNGASWALVAAILVVAIAAALFVHRVFERPATPFVRRLLGDPVSPPRR